MTLSEQPNRIWKSSPEPCNQFCAISESPLSGRLKSHVAKEKKVLAGMQACMALIAKRETMQKAMADHMEKEAATGSKKTRNQADLRKEELLRSQRLKDFPETAEKLRVSPMPSSLANMQGRRSCTKLNPVSHMQIEIAKFEKKFEREFQVDGHRSTFLIGLGCRV